MNELPAPDPSGRSAAPPRTPHALTDAHADRLAALAERRRASSRGPRLESGPTPDPERLQLEARLQALRARDGSANAAPTTTSGSARRARRRHPAQGARLAALGLSLASTGGLAAWFGLSGSTGAGDLAAASVVSSGLATGRSTTAAASADTSQAAGPADVASQVAAPAADTVVDGAVFQNRWGNVQVEATFDASGTLVDVAALQTPGGHGKSVQINDYAVPRLNSEALSSQSANVDTVSGATYTSTDYRRSLQSAIDAARAAGATQLV